MNALFERLNAQREKIMKRKSHEQTHEDDESHFQICPMCGSKKLVMNSGCCNCLNCGWSACG